MQNHLGQPALRLRPKQDVGVVAVRLADVQHGGLAQLVGDAQLGDKRLPLDLPGRVLLPVIVEADFAQRHAFRMGQRRARGRLRIGVPQVGVLRVDARRPVQKIVGLAEAPHAFHGVRLRRVGDHNGVHQPGLVHPRDDVRAIPVESGRGDVTMGVDQVHAVVSHRLPRRRGYMPSAVC